MTVTGESKGRRALQALASLARDSAQPPSSVQLDDGLRAVRARRGGTRGTRVPQRTLRWTILVAVMAASALVALGVVRFRRSEAPNKPAALTYRLEGGTLTDGGYLRASSDSPMRAVFSEGTEFVLMPGTRSRLRAVDASGARIAIEHGLASFQVTPAKDRRWQVDVGPFLVSVKGTAFSVSWDATTERFELKLRHGRVAVSGPLTNGEMALLAGQRLQIDLPRGEAVLKEQKPEEWDELPGDAPPALEMPHDQRGSDRTGPTASPIASMSRDKVGDDRRWAAVLAAGHLDRILAEAERAGIPGALEKVSSDDLMALADAARYRRRVDLARAALLAQRRRFPGSPRSLDAAFLLGRVEEASEGGLARAAQWYDEYLMRAPSGRYASEALGRKMTLTRKLEGNSRARPLAEEYLRRFPQGSYAGPARAFLGTP
jgi:hypothetical protein